MRHRTDQRGAAAVEFALVLPLLAMLLFGIITGGLSYSHALGVTNAVREGARFGATADATNGTTWANDVIAEVRQSQFDDVKQPYTTRICVQLWKITAVGAGTPLVSTTCSGPGPITIPSSAAADPAVPTSASAVGTCVVRIRASRPYTFFIGIAKWDRHLKRGAIAHYERKDKLTTCS